MSNQEMAITNYSLATVWDRELKGDHLKGTLACMDETCGNQTRKANLLLPQLIVSKRDWFGPPNGVAFSETSKRQLFAKKSSDPPLPTRNRPPCGPARLGAAERSDFFKPWTFSRCSANFVPAHFSIGVLLNNRWLLRHHVALKLQRGASVNHVSWGLRGKNKPPP